jgi:hypothetical protein
MGFYERACAPQRIQRYRCSRCRRSFSSQTFSTSYWLRRPDLPRRLFLRLLSCAAYRQLGRDLSVSPTTVMRQVERLGRHCLLFHERLRPRGALSEPLALDGFESFELSQYTPVHYHLAIGARSHFVYGLTDSELRRKGRMTAGQRARREALERRYGRPDPRSIAREVAALLRIVTKPGAAAELYWDDHPAYPRALKELGDRRLCATVTPGRAARTAQNPLFAVNLADLLIRHCQANHKRETIAFSKRRACAVLRHFVFVVWRNALKSFSEKKRDATPAQRLGLLARKLTVDDVLERRLFPTRVVLPERWRTYYDRTLPTRRLPPPKPHRRKYAF